jgi:hypothetical protein
MANDPKLKAKVRADTFYSGLERLLKRYDPRDFGPAMASMVFELIDKPNSWRHYPLHYLIHAIEANCAYHKPPRKREFTQRHINQVMNHYHGYYDPYLQYTLQELKSLEFFALAMARQQFPYQETPGMTELARCLLLFVQGDPLHNTGARFVSDYGFTMYDWVYMTSLVRAYVLDKRPPLTYPANYLDSEIDSIPRSAVSPFLEMSSLSPGEVAAHYHAMRRGFPSYLHIFIPSVFLEYPLIAYDDGAYLAVHPTLLFRHTTNGLYRVCENMDADLFHSEFADSFERYVGKVLSQLANVNRVWTESEVQATSPGAACDYVVDHRDCILLVECKSARYSATLLTENAVAGDNSTGKVAEGFEQIHHTAHRLQAGELEPLLGSLAKPAYGFVVTFGDLRFANSPWYVQTFVIPRMHLSDHSQWPPPLDTEPQVVSIDTLEDIVIALNLAGLSPPDLIEQKLSQRFNEVGDWPQYLATTYKNGATEWELPLLRSAVDAFVAAMQ